VFGLYELFRTWRQRSKDILDFASAVSARQGNKRGKYVAGRKKKIDSQNPFADVGSSLRWAVYERVAEKPEVEAARIRQALDASEILFRRLEALRVHLAKHEIPRQKGSEAMAPGYGRIDMVDGSITYEVLLRDNEVDMISRRTLANAVEHLDEDQGDVFLPSELRPLLKDIPLVHYGVKQVRVTLSDGSVYSRVLVAWDCQLFAVLGQDNIPFGASNIVEVVACDLGPDEQR